MGRLEFIFPLLFIVLGPSSASDCDHVALNVCQNLVKGMHQGLGVNDVTAACEKFQASIECFQDFVDRCFQGVERDEQFAKLTAGIPNMAMLCQDGSVSSEAFERIQCLQKEVKRLQEDGGPCTRDLLASEGLKGDPVDEETVKKACCAFSRYQKCFKDVIIKKCGEKAYNEAIAESKDEMQVVQSACDKYDCSGSGLMSLLPVWLMTGLVAFQFLLGQQ